MTQLQFTIPEMLSLVGLAQCVYVLVYMAFRAGDWRRAALPFLYFLVIGGAFFLDFAARFVGDMVDGYGDWQWALWFAGPPLSVLLIIQVARIGQSPHWPQYWVLFLIPTAYGAARLMTDQGNGEFHEWLVIAGLIAGALSMLTVWAHRGLLEDLHTQKDAKDRYWLILMLITMNSFFLGVMLLGLTLMIGAAEIMMIRTLLGLSFVYLAGTSLFRIYPQAVQLVDRGAAAKRAAMSDDEEAIALKIEALLNLDKIYHEPAYSRADLARELMTPESVISKIINVYFGKSFPQLLNEKRVEDAKRLLSQTDASVKIIAAEVGFNSIASFNRVFRDMTGQTPSAFREKASPQKLAG